MDELKQKNSTVWVNIGEHLVVVSGPLVDCEWYQSRRIVKELHVGESTTILLLG